MDKEALYQNFESHKLGNYVMEGDVPQRERIRLMLDLAKDCGSKLLDCACFDGSISKLFIAQGKEVYGFDIAPKAVEQAKKNGVNAVVLDWETQGKLPFPDAFFDCVVLGEFIEHVYEPEKLLRETRRVLKKGGSAIITTPNLARLNNRFKLFFGGYPQYLECSTDGAGHIRLFTFSKLVEMAQTKGFQVESATSNVVVLPGGLKFKCLAKLAPKLGENIVLKCKAV